jgi:transposase InsO family protein
MIFFDTHRYVKSCQLCQYFIGKKCLPSLPLKSIIVEAPFQQWGLDFIGEFKENSHNGYRWIFTATDYFTRWMEAVRIKKETEEVVMNFLEEDIITRFSVPAKITTDKAKAFSSMALNKIIFKYGIVLSHSSNYCPQGNGLAESSNKNIMNIMKKIVGEKKKSWDSKIKYALWEYRTTTKTSIRKTYFDLVYGLEARLPINIQIQALQISQQFVTDKESLQWKIDQLMELEETQRMAFDKMEKNQE